MPDWGMSGRKDIYRFAQVDPFSLDEINEIECIASDCSITYGYYTDNYSSATIVTPDTYTGGFIRIEHTVELPDGTTEKEVLGTFIVDSVERTKDVGFVKQSLSCYSTM